MHMIFISQLWKQEKYINRRKWTVNNFTQICFSFVGHCLFLDCSSSLGSNVSYSGHWVSLNRVNLPPLDPFSRVLSDSMPHMPLCWLPLSLVSDRVTLTIWFVIVVSRTPPLFPSLYLLVLHQSLAHAFSSSLSSFPPSLFSLSLSRSPLFPPSLVSLVLSRHTSWWENNGSCWNSCHGYSRGTEENSGYL